jgi:hypothetical protein
MRSFQLEIDEAVEAKLRELDCIAFGAATGRRFQVGGMNPDGSIMTTAQHRESQRRVMTDIAQRVGLHFFMMTDAVMLDQLVVVSTIQNHDTAGLLKSLINSFLIAYTNKDTTNLAYQQLQGLELLRARIEKGVLATKH